MDYQEEAGKIVCRSCGEDVVFVAGERPERELSSEMLEEQVVIEPDDE